METLILFIKRMRHGFLQIPTIVMQRAATAERPRAVKDGFVKSRSIVHVSQKRSWQQERAEELAKGVPANVAAKRQFGQSDAERRSVPARNPWVQQKTPGLQR